MIAIMSTKIKPRTAGGSIAVYIGESTFKIVAINASNTGNSWGGGSATYQNYEHKKHGDNEFAGIFDTKIAGVTSALVTKNM